MTLDVKMFFIDWVTSILILPSFLAIQSLVLGNIEESLINEEDYKDESLPMLWICLVSMFMIAPVVHLIMHQR